MKPITNRLSGYAILVFFPILILLRSKHRVFYLFVLMLGLTACFRKFYQTNTQNTVSVETIKSFQQSQKYFILHYPGSVTAMSGLEVVEDTLKANPQPLDPAHSTALSPKLGKENVLKGKNRQMVLSEVHFYTRKDDTLNSDRISIPLRDIYRMDVYSFDKEATTRSTVISVVGIAVVIGLVIASIAAVSSMSFDVAPTTTEGGSCPSVYVKQDNQYQFRNVMYPGSIFSSLERTDYLELGKLNPEGSFVSIRYKSSDKELQHVNMLKLLAVKHDNKGRLMTDVNGKVFFVNEPVTPSVVTAPASGNITELLTGSDDRVYNFSQYDPAVPFSYLTARFVKPDNAGKARLVARARAGKWSYQVHQEFASMLGESYVDFRKAKESLPPAEMKEWFLQQGIPLRVYMRVGETWRYMGYLPFPGLEAYRESILELDLTGHAGKEIELKFETIHRFWDLDMIGMDFSDQGQYSVVGIPVSRVLKGAQAESRDILGSVDTRYVQMAESEYLDVEFELPLPLQQQSIDYILLASGYYYDNLIYPGKPDLGQLEAFNQPKAFDKLSRDKYKEYEALVAMVKKLGVD